MESDDQVMVVSNNTSNFFQGLSIAPKLTQKEKLLRNSIQENSFLSNKQTTLQQKIHNLQRRERRQLQNDNQQIFQEKVMIEMSQGKNKKKKKHEALLTMDSNSKGKSFQELRIIRPILKAIGFLQYLKPTPIQQLAIPVIMTGKDVVASSITGSGKTAAFLIPIIQRYYNVAAVGYIRGLIVTPTRELAIQIFEQFEKLNKFTNLQATLAIGASSIQKQQSSLRNNPELVIGTPGRILDLLINSRSIGIQNLQMIVFDEADKLLQLGFEAEIKQIMRNCNQQVQTILFSATMGKDIQRLTTVTTKKPIRLSADPDNKTAQKLHQQIIKLKENSQQYREAVLISILKNLYQQRVIVFFKTKKQCHRVAIILGLLGLKACQLHGNLSQTQRIQAFHDFKQQKFNYLLATDLASRGLDIKDVKTVINFELPTHLTKYIHRIGRTARAGCVGTSLTLCSDLQCLQLKRMSKQTGDRLFKLQMSDSIIKKYQSTINSMYHEIGQILTQERQEKQIRKAQMQLQKLQNITEYQTQIYSRPKKEWFLSGKQKRTIQEKAKEQFGQKIQIMKTKKISKRNNFSGRQGNRPNKNRDGLQRQQRPNRKFNFNRNSGDRPNSNRDNSSVKANRPSNGGKFHRPSTGGKDSANFKKRNIYGRNGKNGSRFKQRNRENNPN